MRYFNIVMDVDSYKPSHWLQYMPGTTNVFSFVCSRGGRSAETVQFGLQMILVNLTDLVNHKDVDRAANFYKAHGVPFNESGWRHIVDFHRGKLPLRIRAIPEGCVVPTGNALITVENTCPDCFWLTSWVETALLRVWYPITVATESREIKKVIKEYLDRTSDDTNSEINFKLHDFGSRGVSSQESAALGGAAHLVNFMGSDTVVGILAANESYNCEMAAYSIPAAEHSTITVYGREGEEKAYRNMLKQFAKPGALLAVVSDSYDIYNACEKLWGENLRQEVIDSGATVVIRPDSGDPTTVVLKCMQILASKFGFVMNSKGYKVLNNVRIIQGDGINRESIKSILDAITSEGFSATNVAFGMGGALLQMHNRDTQRFAMKCSHVVANGKNIDVYKDPITDPGKRSLKGRLDVIRENGEFKTVKLDDHQLNHPDSIMDTVFENGDITKWYTLAEIRERARV